ncbi:MAG: hypothetical protein HRT52_13325 [Colwellia sp.]|nr:hypothetical protein [Colwellia sp.]
MKDVRQLMSQANHNLRTNQQHAQEIQEVQTPENVISLVIMITQRFEGIYQYTGNRTQQKMALHRQELTQALANIQEQINEDMIHDAIDFFALKGGKFPPNVPEFIQVVLKQHDEIRKHPEHQWFDKSKALPQFTPEQFQSMGKNGIALARQAIKKNNKPSP